MGKTLSNVAGIDDAPFQRGRRGDVAIVAAVCARTRLDGVLRGTIRQDGANATARIAALLSGSPFDRHVRAVLLNGIAVGGFNVVDIAALAETLRRPVLVVARRPPRLDRIRRALEALPGGARKWSLVERAGPMQALRGVYVQRAGLTLAEASDLLAATTLHGNLPEPLRLAHIIAGGLITGTSHGRA